MSGAVGRKSIENKGDTAKFSLKKKFAFLKLQYFIDHIHKGSLS